MDLTVATRALVPTAAIVDVRPEDPLDPRADRSLRRLIAIAPGLAITAVAEDPTPDLYARLRNAGVEKIVAPSGEEHHDGRPRWTVEEWGAWLYEAFGLQAENGIEPMLAILATGGERSASADDLVAAGLSSTRAAAVRRLREVSRRLGGEEFRNPGIVARQAHRALAALAAARPLRHLPAPDLSLQTAAQRLERAPSLAIAAGLSAAEIDALRDLARRLDEVERQVGAPHAGASREERTWAAGRRAAELGADAASIEYLRAQSLADAQEAALAVAQVVDDAPFAAQARLAAAIEALAVLPESARPAWSSILERSALDPHRLWQPTEASQPRVSDRVARRLTTDLDLLLVECGALDRWVQSGRGGYAER